jgi:hypothetical protein
MFSSVLDSLFGCSHQRTTFPITPKGPSVWPGAYVSCLDCGKEFAYNWTEMRRVEKRADRVAIPTGALAQPAEGLARVLRLGN